MHLERKLRRIACRKDVFKFARTLFEKKAERILPLAFLLTLPPLSFSLSPLPCTLQHTFKEPVRKKKKERGVRRGVEGEQSAFPSSLPCPVIRTAGRSRMAACVLRMRPGYGGRGGRGEGDKNNSAVMLALTPVLPTLRHLQQRDRTCPQSPK